MRKVALVIAVIGLMGGAAVLSPGNAAATSASFGPGTTETFQGSYVEIGDVTGSGSPGPDIVTGYEFLAGNSMLYVLQNDDAIPPAFSVDDLSESADSIELARWLNIAGAGSDIITGTGDSIVVYRRGDFAPFTFSSAHGAMSLDYRGSPGAAYAYYTTGLTAGYLYYNGVSVSDTGLGSSAVEDSFRSIKYKPSAFPMVTGTEGTRFLPSGALISTGEGNDLDSGDMDGDGILDVVISKPNQLVWVRCTSAGSCPAGGGDRPVSPVETFLTWTDVETADVDSDGDIDVIANWYPSGMGPYFCWGELSWFENDGQATPSFSEHGVNCPGNGFSPRNFAIGDLDGDGDFDLAYTSASTFSPGYGSTGFRLNQLSFWWEDGFTRAGLGESVAGGRDVNQDGWPDALIASHCSYSSQGGCPLAAPLRDSVGLYLGTATGLQDTPVWTAVGSQENERFGDTLAFGDWNADGFVDVAIGAPRYMGGCNPTYGERVGRVYVWHGGPAGFGDPGTPANADQILAPAGLSNALCYTVPPDGFGAELASADRTGDGIDELVVGDPGYFHAECYPNTIAGQGRVSVFRGGTTGLALSETVAGPTCSSGQCDAGQCGGNTLGEAMGVGDPDGDGRADLVMSRSSSSSADVVTVEYASGASQDVSADLPRDLALADVNGDGFDDVAAAEYDQAELWLGGAGGLTPSTWSLTYPYDSSGLTRVASAGQRDADCYEDLAIAAPTAGNLRVFRGQAGAVGLGLTPVETVSKAWASIAPAGDARRNGIDDLLTGRAAESRYGVQTGTNAGGAAALYQGDVSTTPIPDCDGDGSARNLDCNDRDPAIEPGAVEVCNLRDDDCDNLVDEGLGCNFADADGDGILDDGDHSGVVGDSRCTAGATQGCDDNCRVTANASQVDADSDSRGDACDNCPTLANADQADGDSDSVGNLCDNCTAVANARVSASYLSSNPWATLTGGQRDDDHDGYGNRCDADFTATGALVGTADLTQYRASSGKAREGDTCGTSGVQPCARYDLDETGSLIGTGDLTVFRGLSGKAAGPKCAACPLPCEAGASGSCAPLP